MNDFAGFFIVHGDGLYGLTDYEDLYRDVQQHQQFNTIVSLQDENGVVAIARWNIDGTVAHVLDTVIRPDKRSIATLKTLIQLSRKQFPFITHIRFERGRKKNKEMRLIRLDKLKEK